MTADAHAEIAKLLPWYVNGTLGVAEREQVLEHLESCAGCRDEISLCMEMQASVQQAGPTPILPATTAAQILDGGTHRDARTERWKRSQKWAAAAAVGFVAILGVVTLVPGIKSTASNQPTLNQRFTTATTSAVAQTVDYVLELQFAAGLSGDERALVITGLGGKAVITTDQMHVQIVVRLAPKSLHELEQYAAEIQSRPEVVSAEIVALQLPLR